MRFLADESVSRLVIERLRAGGFDVISIGETRSGAPDEDVLKAADAEGCILITEDRDFGELIIRQRLGIRGTISADGTTHTCVIAVSKQVDLMASNLS